ncbi:MAG: hypothetical protein ABI559_08485 [Chloroflexota bacterium]
MSIATGASTRMAAPRRASVQSSVRTQSTWFGIGLMLSFLVPYVFTSLTEVHHDIYYALYFSIVAAFLTLYVRETKLDVAALFTRAWKWSLGIGFLSTAFVVFNVYSRDATDGPGGLYAVFEFGWRGLAYGTVDALLLTAFPGAVALRMLGGRLDGFGRKISYAALAAVLVLSMTAVYHLGYQQFREDGIGGPEIGNTAISMPLFLTANPVGSILTHATMHAAADVHAYETDLFLPPQTDAP